MKGIGMMVTTKGQISIPFSKFELEVQKGIAYSDDTSAASSGSTPPTTNAARLGWISAHLI
jgi:hypothetical protein